MSVPDHSANGWGKRLTALLPQSWFSAAALTPNQTPVTNGIIGAIMYGIGSGFAFVWSLLTYAQNALRLATNVDLSLLDLASLDFFGTNLPRLFGETAAAFSLRIRAQFVLALGTMRGISTSVNNLLNAESSTMVATVFDAQDNPSLATTLGVKPPSFGVVLSSRAGAPPQSYWAMGSQILRNGQYGGMGYNTALSTPGTFGRVPLDSAPSDVGGATEFAHADGTQPEYFFEYHS